MTPTTFSDPRNADPARRAGLPALLLFDAATCILMAAALLAWTAPLASLSGLPPALLRWAGLLLLPSALLMVIAARQQPRSTALVRLVVAGNLAWAAASVAVVLVVQTLTAPGIACVLLQALAVLVLAAMEWRGLRHPDRR